jgi:hypothetical protein
MKAEPGTFSSSSFFFFLLLSHRGSSWYLPGTVVGNIAIIRTVFNRLLYDTISPARR